MSGRFLQGKHQATAFHGLGLGSNLLVQHSINLYATELAEIASRISLHEYDVVLFVAGTICLAITDTMLPVGTVLLLLMSRRSCHLLTVQLCLLLLVVHGLLALLRLRKMRLLMLNLCRWLLLLV